MSILSYVFDNEWSQRSDINSLRDQNRKLSRSQRTRNRNQSNRIEELEENVGELTLLCRSLLTVLRESGTVDPDEFQAVLQRIDLEDGVADGKVSKPAARRPARRPAR